MNEPTHRITFDPSALTERQLDGLACVVCGDAFAAGSRPVPAGEALGAQVVACASHVQDATAVEQDDAETRKRAARRATWPGSEPDEVRAAAERHAVIDDLSRAIAALEGAIASRDPRRLDQAVTQAGPVVRRARGLIAEWDARRAE